LISVGFFVGQIDVGLDVAGKRSELLVGGDLIFGALAVSKDGLGFFLVVPKIGLGDASFEGFQAFAVLRSVKDNSARG
jgi:hypothetical protein